jgi:hypothetical protein
MKWTKGPYLGKESIESDGGLMNKVNDCNPFGLI